MADDDKTIRLNDDDPDKTVRSGQNIIGANSSDDIDKTVRAGSGIISSDDDATVRADGGFISSDSTLTDSAPKLAVNVTQLSTFLLNQKTYKRIKVISESTGEAQIFLLEKDGEKSVLKLYLPNIKPKEALIKKMRAITHKDILQVLDYGYFEGRFFEILEFAAGGTLDTYLPIRDMKKIKEIVDETADALEFCHSKGIIHRDIKPENIFYKNADGSDVLIGDFGISSLLDENQEAQVTGQARTMVYAAPELYQSLDGKAFVSKELDYYALGITLIKIWTAENPFKGIPEMGIMRIKNLGKLNIPNEMPEELKVLIKGLTVVSIEKRWGYKEIKKWLKGESVPVFVEQDQSKYKPFVYDSDQDLVANTPIEMAKLLQDYPAIGKKYLYRGRIKDWLDECNNQKLSVSLEEIYETNYPKDEDAGLQAAIYMLDPDLPYIAVDGTKCRSIEEFVNVLQEHKEEYMERLQNKNDSFYLYFSAHGLNKEVKQFRKFFKDYVDYIAILHVIYSLNPEAPFMFEDGDPITTPEELSSRFFEEPDRAKEVLFSHEVAAWLFYVDQGLLGQINSIVEQFEKNQAAGVICAAYALDPTIGYNAIDDSYCTTKEELAEALVSEFKKYSKQLRNVNDEFYMFLIARGLTNEYNAFRGYYSKGHNKGKIGFTSADITLYKIIRGLGGETPLHFEGKKFTKPDQLKNIDANLKPKLLTELDKKDSMVNAWLSVFFHEDPFLVFKKTGDYERKLKEYVQFVEQIHADATIVKRFNSGVKYFHDLISNEAAIDQRFNIVKWLFLIVPLLAAGALTYYVYNLQENPLPGAFWDVSSYYYIAIVILTMLFVLIGMLDDGEFSFSTLLFGGPILGLIVAVVVYYIFMLTVSLWYILAGILAVSLYFVFDAIFRGKYQDPNMRKALFDPNDFSGYVFEPLQFAFNDEPKFISSKDDLLKTYKKSRRSTKFMIFKYSAIPTLAYATLLFFLMYHDPSYKEMLRPEEYRQQLIQDSIKAADEKKAAEEATKKKPTRRTRRTR